MIHHIHMVTWILDIGMPSHTLPASGFREHHVFHWVPLFRRAVLPGPSYSRGSFGFLQRAAKETLPGALE